MERSSPFHWSPRSWRFWHDLERIMHKCVHDIAYLAHVQPQSIPRHITTFYSKMICIHCRRLARIVTRLVGIFVVHVIRDSELCQYNWVVTHIIQAFLSYGPQLVSEAISYGSLANLNSKSRAVIFATHNSKDVNVPISIPFLRH